VGKLHLEAWTCFSLSDERERKTALLESLGVWRKPARARIVFYDLFCNNYQFGTVLGNVERMGKCNMFVSARGWQRAPCSRSWESGITA
jgi:hypothetical protein